MFCNSWGKEWGKDGYAMLPFAYYDKYGFEQWEDYHKHEMILFQSRKPKKGWLAWQARNEFDQRMYAFEMGDPSRERIGWVFAVETEEAIEVEELFVVPEARRRGIARDLADFIVHLAAAKSMPIRLWVPFADTIQESHATAGALPAIASRLGVTFHPSPVPWAAYFATSEFRGSDRPIEPEQMPGRPKSTMGALTAFVASLGMTATPIIPHMAEPSVHAVAAQKITLDSPEWVVKNSRRAVLIRKKNRQALEPAEQKELEELQQMAVALVEAAAPRPELLAQDLEARLAAKAHR
jgi:GNAT superfamily N-acetyltransferase